MPAVKLCSQHTEAAPSSPPDSPSQERACAVLTPAQRMTHGLGKDSVLLPGWAREAGPSPWSLAHGGPTTCISARLLLL